MSLPVHLTSVREAYSRVTIVLQKMALLSLDLFTAEVSPNEMTGWIFLKPWDLSWLKQWLCGSVLFSVLIDSHSLPLDFLCPLKWQFPCISLLDFLCGRGYWPSGTELEKGKYGHWATVTSGCIWTSHFPHRIMPLSIRGIDSGRFFSLRAWNWECYLYT